MVNLGILLGSLILLGGFLFLYLFLHPANLHITGEGNLGCRRPEQVIRNIAPTHRLDLNRLLLDAGGRHLAGYKPLPDQGVKLEFIRRQVRHHALGRTLDIRWTNGLMGFLRRASTLEEVWLLREILLSELLLDETPAPAQRILRNVERVGTHIGDQADGAIAQIDTFI